MHNLHLGLNCLSRCQLSKQKKNGNMGRDEQIEEREVLDSIFSEEITGAPDLSCSGIAQLTDPPDISQTSYRISIALDIAHQAEDADPCTTSPDGPDLFAIYLHSFQRLSSSQSHTLNPIQTPHPAWTSPSLPMRYQSLMSRSQPTDSTSSPLSILSLRKTLAWP